MSAICLSILEPNHIYQGNCLELMKLIPDGSVDCIITSPPYNKQNSKCHGYLKRKIEYGADSDSIREDLYQEEQLTFLDSCHRVLKATGNLFYNHKVRFFNGTSIHPMAWILKSKLNLRQEIIWNRKKALNIGGSRFWQIEERIYWLNKSGLGYEMLHSRHALLKSVWEIGPQQGNYHPAAFPVVLPARILYSIFSDDKGKLVLDPYSGSGTTCLVAQEMGHDFIGIEKNADYIGKSLERLKNPDSQDFLSIKDEKKLHFVQESYQERKKSSQDHYLKTGKTEKIENDFFGALCQLGISENE